MKGATMLENLYSLGITPWRSRPRVSDDNSYAESLFKTLKYVSNFQPQGFTSITRGKTLDKEILVKRNEVYERAKVS